MSNFAYCISSLFKEEGGYQDYETDKGNYYPYGYSGTLIGTNFGITPTRWKNYFGYVPTVEDMETISKAEAEQFYYDLFWIPYGLNKIQNKYVANIVFDTLILFSYTSFAQIVPMSGTKIGFTKLNSTNPSKMIDDIIARRIDMHNYNVSQGYVSGDYLDGWINRANSFKITNQQVGEWIPYVVSGVGIGFLIYYYNRKK